MDIKKIHKTYVDLLKKATSGTQLNIEDLIEIGVQLEEATKDNEDI